MIIECRSCHARFRLDETKIRGKGARVKCRRCGDSIIVLKEGGPDAPSLQSPPAPPPGNLIPFPVPARGPGPAEGEPPAPGPAEAFAAEEGAPLSREIPEEKDEVDLAFERILAAAEESPAPEPPPPPAAEEPGPLPEEPASLSVLPETPEPPPSFRGEETFLLSDSENLDFLKEGPAAAPSSDISPHLSETPVDQDAASLRTPSPAEVPATEEPAAAAVVPEEISIERNETPPACVAEPAAPTLREEPPPASTAGPRFPEREEPAPSRRGVSPALIAGAGLALLLLAGVGYFGFTPSGRRTIESVVPGAAGIWGGKTDAKAGPQYDVRNVIGYYETGSEGKRILVIKGQVTNLSAKEKSGIRIAAAILDSADKPLAEQMVYAGNTISGEMLRKAGRETIRKVLANRFGDQLTNMNVGPGKSLPFMVVFFDAPESIDSYRLEARDDQ